MSDRNLEILLRLQAMGNVAPHMKEAKAATSNAGKAFKETRERLKELNKAQRDLTAFRNLKRDLQSTTAEMAAAQKRAQDLAAKISAVEKPTRAMSAEMRRARQEVRALKETHAQQGGELNRLRDNLARAGLETRNMAAGERRLREEVARTTRELEQQKDKLDQLNRLKQRQAGLRAAGGRTQRTAAGLAAAGAGMTATGGVGLAATMAIGDEAAEFNAGMTDIALKANLGRKAAAAMGKELIALGPVVNQLPEDLQAGVDRLAGMGLAAKDAVRLMRPIGKAATAYRDASIEDLSGAGFSTVQNLGVKEAEIGKVLDVMAHAGKAGNFEIADMSQAFPALTAAAQALGQKGVPAVADLAAALQIVRRGTGDSASAATNLENLFQKIAAPQTVKAFSKMGVNLEAEMKAALARGLTPIEAISEITNRTLKGDLSKLGNLFQDAQVQKALRPLIQNMALYRQIRADALGAEGTVDADFARRMQDDAEATKAMRIQLSSLKKTMGNELLPTLTKVKAAAGGLMQGFATFAQAHPGVIKLVAALVAVWAVLGGLALVAAAVLAPFAMLQFAWAAALPLLGPLAAGIGAATAAAWGFAAALLANPITWIVLAIVALIAAGVLLWKNWDQVSAFFGRVWENIKAFFSGGILAVTQRILAFSPAGLFAQIFAAVWPWIAQVGARFLQFGGDLISGLINGIKGKLAALKGTIVGAAKAAAGWFKKALGINSPSRVFAELGGHTMTGVAMGVGQREGDAVDRVRKAAGRVTAAFALGSAAAAGGPAMAAPGGAGAPPAAAAPITINVYGAPGQSAQELAQEVERILDQREARKAARARSSYGGSYDD